MTATLLGTWEPGSEPWHEARRNRLGGSEIAAVLGLSPFESRFSLWHRKRGAVGQVEETNEMRWGKLLEPLIKGEFEQRFPDWYVVDTGTWVHDERPWQLGNPDALLYRDFTGDPPAAILETKLSMFGDGWGEDRTDEVPPHVRTQCIWYGDTLGIDVVHVCVLIAVGLEPRTYTLTWEPDEAELLRTAGEQFLDEVARGIRPAIDGHTETYQVVKELHPLIDGTEVEIPGVLAERYCQAKALAKVTEEAARQATAEVADLMGDAQRATCDGRMIARRQVREGGLPYVVAARGVTDTPIDEPLVGANAGGTWADPDGGPDF